MLLALAGAHVLRVFAVLLRRRQHGGAFLVGERFEVAGDVGGELGDNLPEVDLGTGRRAVPMASGRYHTCALLDDASVKCWGRNADGQLGIGYDAVLASARAQTSLYREILALPDLSDGARKAVLSSPTIAVPTLTRVED